MAETKKIKRRWTMTGEYDYFIHGKRGIDIGVGRIDAGDGADPISKLMFEWHDRDKCDAHTMEIYPDNSFDVCWISHVLEHMERPRQAIENWIRITKPGGHLFIYVPHVDYYECKRTLPSQFNSDHKFFIHPFKSSPPCTFSLVELCDFPTVEILRIEVCDYGWTRDGEAHPDGEYSCLAILRKRDGTKQGSPPFKLLVDGKELG